MFEHRYGIKLKATSVDATVLKLLRRLFPDKAISELKAIVQAHDYVFLTDTEEYDGERRVAKLLREFDKAGVKTELFEEFGDGSDSWRAEPLSREVLKNMLHSGREIERQTLEDIEHETAEGD